MCWSDEQIEARQTHIWAKTGKMPTHLRKANDPDRDPEEDEDDECELP
jgi:hypothetical protein